MNLQFSITICLSFFTARWYVVTKGNSDSLLNSYELTMMPGGGGLPYETDGDARRLA